MAQPFDPVRYPYAALALSVPEHAKDHFAAVVARNGVSLEHAARVVGSLIAQAARRRVPRGVSST